MGSREWAWTPQFSRFDSGPLANQFRAAPQKWGITLTTSGPDVPKENNMTKQFPIEGVLGVYTGRVLAGMFWG